MDPNATYDLWVESDHDEALEHGEALLAWLLDGGFKPDAFDLAGNERAFRAWCLSFNIPRSKELLRR